MWVGQVLVFLGGFFYAYDAEPQETSIRAAVVTTGYHEENKSHITAYERTQEQE